MSLPGPPSLGRPLDEPRSPGARPPSYAPPPLSLLIAPPEHRLSYLQGDSVEGVIYVKGLGSGTVLDSLHVRLTARDRFLFQPDIILYRTSWAPVYIASSSSVPPTSQTPTSTAATAKHIEAFGRPPPFHPNEPLPHRRRDTNSNPNELKFSIPLDSPSFTAFRSDPRSEGLPGCVHLEHSGGGEVSYELTIKAKVMLPGTSVSSDSTGGVGEVEALEVERTEMREDHTIHLTPHASHIRPEQGISMEDEDGAGPSTTAAPQPKIQVRETDASKRIERAGAEAVIRLLLSRDRVRMDERLPVGVEIGSVERVGGGKSGLGSTSAGGSLGGTSGMAIKGLRRVKVELWRKVRVPSFGTGVEVGSNGISAEGEAGAGASLDTELSTFNPPSFAKATSTLILADPTTSGSSFDAPPEGPTRTTDHLTLLHKSGKSCRFSPSHPVRLLFELPSLKHISSTTSSAGSAQSIAASGYGSCGEITQSTPYHDVTFFVRAIAGFDGEESGDVLLDKEITVDRSEGRGAEDDGRVDHESSAEDEGDFVLPPEAWQESVDDGPAAPMDEATRSQIYRLKGQDFVGDSGTNRVAESGGPSGTSGEGEGGSADPPPFSERLGDVPLVFDGAEGRAIRIGGPPTFAESQHHSREPTLTHRSRLLEHDHGRDSHRSVGSSRRHSRSPPPTAQLTGELSTWIEYDGYETFSQPPPAAAVSMGSSTSMDMPQEGDEIAVGGDFAGGALAREISAGRPIGIEERVRLMERLGLGEGTRVFDMHGDLPPGIDEPSLPALPHAIMPHHRRARQASLSNLPGIQSDHSSAPPAFASAVAGGNVTAAGGQPPPSFAASEAAEARGMVAAGPDQATVSAALSGGLRVPSTTTPEDASSGAVGIGSSGGRTPDLPPTYEGHSTATPIGSPRPEAPPGYA